LLYRKDEEKTRRNRIGDFFAVGDLGYLDEDGYLFLRDRKIDLIISGSVNVYLAEIEAVLLTTPASRTPPRSASRTTTGARRSRPSSGPLPVTSPAGNWRPAVLAHCAARLAGYKWPKSVDFVAEMPRDPNGKLYKRRLRQPYWEDDHTG
jgi:long-chain acyl-CoA synthetase